MNLYSLLQASATDPLSPNILLNVTQQTANTFALNFAKVLSCFNVSTERGENREWEVGNPSRYDDFDTKQSGTRLLM